MFCPKCGNKIQQNQKNCAKCGYKIDDSQNILMNNIPDVGEETTTQVSTANEFVNKILKNKKFLNISVVVIILILGVIITFVFVSGKDISNNKINDSAIGDYESSAYVDNDNTIETQKPDNKETMAIINLLGRGGFDNISGDIVNARLTTYDGKTYYDSIIDFKGNVRYVCDESEYLIYAPTSEDDIGWIEARARDSNRSYAYKLINAKGEIIKEGKRITSESDESEYEYVVACGNGNAVIYRYEANINTESHLFGVINSSGEWVIPLKDYGQEHMGWNNIGSYIGENIFDIPLDSSGYYHMFLNGKTGESFWVLFQDEVSKIPTFEDGVLYFYNYAYVSDIPLEIDDNYIDQLDLYETSHDFALYPDGTWKALPDDFPSLNGYKKAGDKWIKPDGDYLVIYDYDTKTESKFTAYENSLIDTNRIYFKDDYSIVRIIGKDNKNYFTLIDTMGKMQFEPIAGYAYEYYSDKIIFRNEANTLSVVDKTGKFLHEYPGYDTAHCSWGDLIGVSNGYDENLEGYIIKLIDLDGNIIIDQVKLPNVFN